MFPPRISSPQNKERLLALLKSSQIHRGEKPKLTTQDAFEIL